MYLNFFAPWLCPTIHLPILCLDTKTKKRELLSRSMMGHFDNEIDCGRFVPSETISISLSEPNEPFVF